MFVKCVKDMRIIWAEVHVERERKKKDPGYQNLIDRHDASRRGAFRLYFNSFFYSLLKDFLNFDLLFS